MRHILPNTIGPILIVASMDVPFVIALEAGLSFLGLGVRPPTPSWGSILNDGYTYIGILSGYFKRGRPFDPRYYRIYFLRRATPGHFRP